MPINDTQIRNAKPADKVYRLTDGGGLQLEVRPTGAKLWRYRYRIDGRENMFAGGEYVQPPRGETPQQAANRVASGLLTLAEARSKRAEWRAAVVQGKHPMALRAEERRQLRRVQSNTFQAIAEAWIAERKKNRWRPAYAGQVERTLSHHVFPAIGARPIADVKARDLIDVIENMTRRRKAEQSSKSSTDGFKVLQLNVRQWCSAVFRRAISEELIESDPTAALRGRFERQSPTNHHNLSKGEIVELLTRIESYGGNPKTAIALRLLLLTFVRPGELRQAKWSEFNFDDATWTIPESRMKMKRTHLVYLAPQAMVQLQLLQSISGESDLLFPNERDAGRPMSATTLNRALERMALNGKGTIDFSAHGFRATASTILNESQLFSIDAIEVQLAHKRAGVRGIYNKAEHWDERREMMKTWAGWIDSFVGGSAV